MIRFMQLILVSAILQAASDPINTVSLYRGAHSPLRVVSRTPVPSQESAAGSGVTQVCYV